MLICCYGIFNLSFEFLARSLSGFVGHAGIGSVIYVPQLDAALITRRTDVFAQGKRVDIFSSHQPEGLMTRLKGENMIRKDGPTHQAERK